MSQFKIGDWVIDQYDKIIQLKESDLKGVGSKNQTWFNQLTVWQPKEGEFVVLENLDSDSFSVIRWNDDVAESVQTPWNIFNLRYEPFIGQLPSFLKEY